MSDRQPAKICSADIARLRPELVRFAMLRLHNASQAEDAVQETLVAAIEGIDRFSGAASLRTWLIGILKHKIVDCVRTSAREHWVPMEPDMMAAEHGNPEQAFWRRRVLQRLESCLSELPVRTAQVFLLRDGFGMNTAEASGALAISSCNCAVLLHRARRRLRAHLTAGGIEVAV